MNIVCFHNPDEENGYLSNWYLSEFECGGIRFSSMEQYMMYQKANCFGDTKIAEKILQTTDVAQIKDLGRKVSNYNEIIWNGKRQIVVYNGLCAKFQKSQIEIRTKSYRRCGFSGMCCEGLHMGDWIVDDRF